MGRPPLSVNIESHRQSEDFYTGDWCGMIYVGASQFLARIVFIILLLWARGIRSGNTAVETLSCASQAGITSSVIGSLS